METVYISELIIKSEHSQPSFRILATAVISSIGRCFVENAKVVLHPHEETLKP